MITVVKCTCASCGIEFEVSLSEFNAGGGKYCSRPCFNQTKKKRVKCKCLTCSKEFEIPKSAFERGRGRYCSIDCFKLDNKVETACQICGVVFVVYKNELEGGRHKYCSQKCYHLSHRNSVECVCGYCQKIFEVTASALNDGRGKYCSQECCDKARAFDRTCEYCGKTFRVWRNQVKRRAGKYCSKECRGKAEAGPNHPRWRGGGVNYRGPNWLVQRKAALKRDNYTCQYCNQQRSRRSLEVHHKTPFREFGYIQGENENYKQANELANLITLCGRCHRKAECGKIVV